LVQRSSDGTTTRAALGLRVHSGWAALVAIAGLPEPTIIERRRIELADAETTGSTQPYHAAEALDLTGAQEFIQRCSEKAEVLAQSALQSVVHDLEQKGYQVVSCAVLLSSGRPGSTLATTLASHALIHTAEGELFRQAVIRASGRCGLSVTTVKERELYRRVAAELGLAREPLRKRLAELGAPLGPPWREDQKCATLVAWLTLAAGHDTST
jgi:hypothetical protein